jgi:hypothetical protein
MGGEPDCDRHPNLAQRNRTLPKIPPHFGPSDYIADPSQILPASLGCPLPSPRISMSVPPSHRTGWRIIATDDNTSPLSAEVQT